MSILGAFGWFSMSPSHEVMNPWTGPLAFLSCVSFLLDASVSLSELYVFDRVFLIRVFSARFLCIRFSTLLLYGVNMSLPLEGELHSFVSRLVLFFGLLVRSRLASWMVFDGDVSILDRAFRWYICSGVASLSASGVSDTWKPPGPRFKLFSSGVSSPLVKSKAGALLGVRNAAMSISLLGGGGNGLSGELEKRDKKVVWPAAGRSWGMFAVDIDLEGDSKSDLVPGRRQDVSTLWSWGLQSLKLGTLTSWDPIYSRFEWANGVFFLKAALQGEFGSTGPVPFCQS